MNSASPEPLGQLHRPEVAGHPLPSHHSREFGEDDGFVKLTDDADLKVKTLIDFYNEQQGKARAEIPIGGFVKLLVQAPEGNFSIYSDSFIPTQDINLMFPLLDKVEANLSRMTQLCVLRALKFIGDFARDFG